MSVVTATYERKTFRVEAVRVTSDNMEEVAEWCGGRVVNTDGFGYGRKHVQVPTGKGGESIAHAYIGNWVTCLVKAQSFRVYKEKSFLEAFSSIMSETERFAKVYEMLMSIRHAQDVATYHGEGSADVLLLVDQTARQICEMMQEGL